MEEAKIFFFLQNQQKKNKYTVFETKKKNITFFLCNQHSFSAIRKEIEQKLNAALEIILWVGNKKIKSESLWLHRKAEVNERSRRFKWTVCVKSGALLPRPEHWYSCLCQLFSNDLCMDRCDLKVWALATPTVTEKHRQADRQTDRPIVRPTAR